MSTRQKAIFFWGGLLFSLALAVFISPFASSFPDGLEKVAESHGFPGKGDLVVWQHAVFPDYEYSGASNPFFNALAAGGLGTVAAALLAWGLGRLITLRKKQ